MNNRVNTVKEEVISGKNHTQREKVLLVNKQSSFLCRSIFLCFVVVSQVERRNQLTECLLRRLLLLVSAWIFFLVHPTSLSRTIREGSSQKRRDSRSKEIEKHTQTDRSTFSLQKKKYREVIQSTKDISPSFEWRFLFSNILFSVSLPFSFPLLFNSYV